MRSTSQCVPRFGRIRRVLEVFGFLVAFLFAGLVADSADDGNFRVERGKREMPEIGTFPEWVVWTPGTRVGVLAPLNCPGEPEYGEKRLKFQLEGHKGFILLEFTSQSPGLASAANDSGLLRLVQDRFPESTIHPAGRAYVGGDQGWAFDIERVTAYKTSLTTRLAFVATSEGLLEISMTTATPNFQSLWGTFVGFLTCARIQPIKSASR